MKFSVDTKSFRQALKTLVHISPRNAAMPVIENIEIILSETGKLMLCATNLEQTMQVRLSAVQDDYVAGRGLINAQVLSKTLDSFTFSQTDIEVEASGASVVIKNGTGAYKIGADTEEFPLPAIHTDGATFNISLDLIKQAIKHVLFAVSTNEFRPAMSGVHIEVHPNHLLFIATDAHRLAIYEAVCDTGISEKTSFTLPKATCAALLKIEMEGSEELSVKVSQSGIAFISEPVVLISQLITERYPDYKTVMPRDHQYSITVERASLSEATKRAIIFADKAVATIGLSCLDDTTLMIDAKNADYGLQSSETIDCYRESKPQTATFEGISFNGKFLLEALQAFNASDVTFYLSEPYRAGLLKSPEQNELVVLLMPIMVRN